MLTMLALFAIATLFGVLIVFIGELLRKGDGWDED
jgi:hypothetical protein